MAENVTDQAKIDKDRRTAYGRAQKALRERFAEEFTALYEQECETLGVPFQRRLTPREKAEAQMKALLAEYPDLAQ